MNNTSKSLAKNQLGFTIIELMIATLVFSVILTVITAGVVSFTNRYYKGANVSATQNTTRSIVDTISQAIQFGSARVIPTTPTDNFFCAGGYVFTYSNTGALYTGDATQMGLYMSPMGSTCKAQNLPTSGGKQLLAKNMRLTNLTVSALGNNLYSIAVSVAYGPGDLLCASSQPGTCNGSRGMNFWPVSDVVCRSTAGSQYCAASSLKTTIQQRIST